MPESCPIFGMPANLTLRSAERFVRFPACVAMKKKGVFEGTLIVDVPL